MQRNVRAPLAGCLSCVAGLGLLALLVYGSGSAQGLDRTVRDRLIADPGSGAESLATTVAHLGDPLVMLLLLALACGIGWKCGRRREALAALAVVAGANLTTQLLKVLVSHPRVRSILGAEGFAWDGFPSGHTTSVASLTIAFAFVLPARFRPLVWVLGACLTAGVGCAVVVLHRHFPSDVPGGVLVAGAWGFGALAVLRLVRGDAPQPLAQPSRRAAISLK